MVKTYTELRDGSHNVSVVLHNLMGKLVHLSAGRLVARVMAANAILDAAPSPEFLRKLDELEPNRKPPKEVGLLRKDRSCCWSYFGGTAV